MYISNNLSANAVFLNIMNDKMPFVAQDQPEALHIFNLIKSICAKPNLFLSPHSRFEDKNLLFSKMLSYFRYTILSPIKNYSQSVDFWKKLFLIMGWVAEIRAEHRLFIRKANGNLLCKSFTSDAVPIKWDTAEMGCRLFVINLEREDVDREYVPNSQLVRLCRSIVLTFDRTLDHAFMEGNIGEDVELLQDGIDLSGRKVRVRFAKTFAQSGLNQKVNFHSFDIATAITVYGATTEMVKMTARDAIFRGEVVIEKPVGDSLGTFLEEKSLDMAQRKLLAFHLVRMVDTLHKKSPHGGLSFDTIFINGNIEDLNALNADTYSSDLSFFLIHDHPWTFYSNNGPFQIRGNAAARFINGWLFQPFEMVPYILNKLPELDVIDFYKQVDSWSLGAMIMVILFPETLDFWKGFERKMRKLTRPSKTQQNIIDFVRQLFLNKNESRFETAVLRLLQIEPTERAKANKIFRDLLPEFKKRKASSQ